MTTGDPKSHRHARLVSAAGTFIAALAVASCSSGDPAQTVAMRSTPIIHGVPSDDSQNAIVRYTIRGAPAAAFCSGVLVAPNLMLTARHCLAKTMSPPAGYPDCSDPKGIATVAFGALFAANTLTVSVGTDSKAFSEQALGTKIYRSKGDRFCGDDVLLILLDRDLSPPPARIRLYDPPAVGETFTAIGWGSTESAEIPTQRMQRAGVPILAVGPDVADGRKLPDGMFMTGESGCFGDSGSPALSETTKGVIGVATDTYNGTHGAGGFYNCIGADDRTIWSSLVPHRDWILAAFAEAGHEPLLDGPDRSKAPFAGACTADADCQSGICVTGACSQACSEVDVSVPCPDGYGCKIADGRSVCVAPTAADAGADSAGGAGGATPAPSGKSGCATTSSAGCGNSVAVFGLWRRAEIIARKNEFSDGPPRSTLRWRTWTRFVGSFSPSGRSWTSA